MNTMIKIHDNNTKVTGTYRIYFKNSKGVNSVITLSENDTTSILDMKQKEDFFIGKYRFKIKSEYDFRNIILREKNVTH